MSGPNARARAHAGALQRNRSDATYPCGCPIDPHLAQAELEVSEFMELHPSARVYRRLMACLLEEGIASDLAQAWRIALAIAEGVSNVQR